MRSRVQAGAFDLDVATLSRRQLGFDVAQVL